MEKIFKDLGVDNFLTEDNEFIKEMIALLTLEEDKFKVLAPIFLQQLEKEWNTPSIRLGLIEEIHRQNLDGQELLEGLTDLLDAIDDISEEDLKNYQKDFFKAYLIIMINVLTEEFGEGKDLVTIPIEFCHEDAKMPAYARLGDAGLDVYALEDIDIAPGETKLVKIGIKVAIPMGYELQVRPKSGKTLKSKLRVANTPGTIDSGYRDEIGVIIENIEAPIKNIETEAIWKDNIIDHLEVKSIEYGNTYTIGKGQKFAQLVLNKVSTANFTEVNNVAEIGENRGGGFGSTGLN